jgi:hypothetical protein
VARTPRPPPHAVVDAGGGTLRPRPVRRASHAGPGPRGPRGDPPRGHAPRGWGGGPWWAAYGTGLPCTGPPASRAARVPAGRRRGWPARLDQPLALWSTRVAAPTTRRTRSPRTARGPAARPRTAGLGWWPVVGGVRHGPAVHRPTREPRRAGAVRSARSLRAPSGPSGCRPVGPIPPGDVRSLRSLQVTAVGGPSPAGCPVLSHQGVA